MNFVLFYPETVRADAVIDKGIARAQTPTLDRIAKEGVTFSNCFAQSPFCTPSRCSTFTGTYPHVRGHRSLMHLLHPDERNLFQDLHEAGYETVCFGKNDLVADGAVNNSFDIFNPSVLPKESTKPVHSEYDNPEHKYYSAFYRGSLGNSPVQDADWAYVESALQYIDKKPTKPFCLFLPLHYAHPPYQVEEPFFSLHNREDVPEPIPTVDRDGRGGFDFLRRSRKLGRLDSDDFREIKAVYFGMISRLDYQLGLIVEKLEQTNLLNSTALFYLSDHGDYAGDYGQVEKWNYGFDDCLLNVPLIARIPGFSAAGMCMDLVESIDIYPTILELASVDTGHYHMGTSLVSLMRGGSHDPRRGGKSAVFAEAGWNTDEHHCFTPLDVAVGRYAATAKASRKNARFCTRSVMIRTDRYKYVYSPDERDELFNLVEDPSCTKNIADDPETVPTRQELRSGILEWLVKTSDTVPLVPDARSFPQAGIRRDNITELR